MEPYYRKKQYKVTYNVLTILWLAIGVLIMLLGWTYVDENVTLAVKCLGAAMMGVIGIVMTALTVGIGWDREITKTEITQTIFLIGVSCFGVLIINVVTLKYMTFETAPMPRSLFSVMIGQFEEVLFRGFLQTWLMAFTRNLFISVGVSNVIFGTFHGAVYGLDPAAVIIVIGAGFMIGFVYEIGLRQLHITQSAHGIINFMAYAGESIR
ncbi:MAG: CPBP family intramembrane metalloprotease [Candidatus Bathyarchaeota archaeon]|nr:CPBP family intramembrane metalloprotease [Candidatus Bathyarchaeota archaeon]